MERIAIASDHAGRDLKVYLEAFLTERGFDVIDMGTDDDASVDYPDYGIPLAGKISSGEVKRGVLVCGTGVGMSILANKFKGVRAALVSDTFTARMSREHNDSNIIVIGGRVTGKDLAKDIVKSWLDTPFEGGRHQRRLDKIKSLEEGWK